MTQLIISYYFPNMLIRYNSRQIVLFWWSIQVISMHIAHIGSMNLESKQINWNLTFLIMGRSPKKFHLISHLINRWIIDLMFATTIRCGSTGTRGRRSATRLHGGSGSETMGLTKGRVDYLRVMERRRHMRWDYKGLLIISLIVHVVSDFFWILPSFLLNLAFYFYGHAS
jgi:hypothetical protein